MKFIVPYKMALAFHGSVREALDHAEFCGTSPEGSWLMPPDHEIHSVSAHPPLFKVVRIDTEGLLNPEGAGDDKTVEVVFHGAFLAEASDDFVAASAVESLSNEGWWGDNAEIFRFEVGTPYPSPSQRVNYLAIELTIDHVPDEDIGWPDPHRAVEQGIRKALEPYKFIHVGEIRSVATTGSAGDNLLLLTNEELTALTQLLAAEEHVFTSHNVLRAVLESITKETE